MSGVLSEVFVQVCWMSITALIVAVPVMLLLLGLDALHVPKRFSNLLFALVLLRMVFPGALPSDWSLFNAPFIQTVQQEAMPPVDGPSGTYEIAVEGTEAFQRAVEAGVVPEPGLPDHPDSIQAVFYQEMDGAIRPADRAMDTSVPVLAKVWLSGMLLFYGLTLLSYLRLRYRLRFAVKLEGNVYVCDRIPSPCVAGYFRPRIYLVPRLNEEERSHILAHERAHLRAGDHWAKLIAWLALGAHWFNPWLWGVHHVYCTQLELACDEQAVRTLGIQERTAYSQTLLNLAYDRRFRWLNPVSFTEGGTKERVQNVLRFRNARPAALLLTAAAVIVMAVICGTGGARSDVLAAEEPVAIVTDHTGRLTQDQIQALAVGEWAYTGFSEDLDWINTRSFFAMEVLSVEQSGERYTLETLQGNVLFSWLLHGTDYEDGVAVAAFGIPCALRTDYLWRDGQFMYLGSESVGETPQLGDAAFDLSGCSERARETAEASGAGIATLMETLCRQAEVWYGCEAFNNDCFYEGRVGGWNIMPNGSWIFYEYRDGDREENVRQCEGNFVALSMLADTPAGTDLSGWSHEQVAWALAGAGGAFAQEAAEELYSRLCAAPEAVLREITALGQSRRSAVLWHLAGEACAGKASDDERDWIEGLNRLSALPPAVQDTAQRFEQYCDVRRSGAAAPPEDKGTGDTWAVSGPTAIDRQMERVIDYTE